MSKNVKGILGEKLGMTQVWDENNKIVPVTVVKAGPCVVTQVRSADSDGYSAVQLGFGAIDPRKVNKPTGWALRQGRRDPAPSPGRAAHRRRSASTRSAKSLAPTCSRPARRSTSPARPRARASPEP